MSIRESSASMSMTQTKRFSRPLHVHSRRPREFVDRPTRRQLIIEKRRPPVRAARNPRAALVSQSPRIDTIVT